MNYTALLISGAFFAVLFIAVRYGQARQRRNELRRKREEAAGNHPAKEKRE